jgi:hypothetical protein
MNQVLCIVLIVILFALVYQDFKHRAISWVFLVLFAGGLLAKGFLETSGSKIGSFFLINGAILVVQFTVLIVYFRMKGYRFNDFWKGVMGAGDFLFLLCTCLAFAPFNFMLFLLSGLLFTLLGYGVMKLVKAGQDRPIPFAGFLAGFLILFLFAGNVLGKWNGYDNELVFKLFRP